MNSASNRKIYPILRPQKRPIVFVALEWYSAAIHKGIARYARQKNWILDTSLTRTASAGKSWHGDGIISLLKHSNSLIYKSIRDSKLPLVNIGSKNIRGVPTVRCDDNAVGIMAGKHFLRRGFKNFAFFLGNSDPCALRRGNAFLDFGKKFGCKTFLIKNCLNNRGYCTQSDLDPIRALGKKLKFLPKPLAVFCDHDDFGIDVIYACQSMGIHVPERVAVLGVDNDALRCDFCPIPLSSIEHNQEMEGYLAASTLDRILNGEQVSSQVFLVQPERVQTRLSTDILAIKHPHVAKALLTIWQNYTKPINAKTVAADSSISYRRLHDAFFEHVGRTIADEITFKRMELAKNLLSNTELSLREISDRSGFSSEDRMGRIFRRELNITPAKYRKQHKLK